MDTLSALTEQLRIAGFAISPAVLVDIANILPQVSTPLELKLALRMLIATSKQEQELFDFIWDLKTRELKIEEETDDKSPNSDISDSGDADEFENMIDIPMTDAPYCPNPESITAGTIGSNDPSVALIRFASDLKGPAKQMIQGNENNAGAMLLRYLLSATSDLSKFGIQRALALKEIGDMLDFAVPDHSEDLIRKLDIKLDELLQEKLSNRELIGYSKLKLEKIEELPLLQLQSSPELTQVLQKLGKKLASKHKRKLKQGNHRINLRQTIRANIQHGGTLLELREQQKRLDKPKLVIMTDVSTSTIQATRMFLSIIWHARQVFSDIHFFEFIASTIDVTTAWRRAQSVNEAVDEALKQWNRMEFGKQNSDYYQAFSMFERLYGKNLTSKHTLIVLGDLRDWLGPWKEDIPVSATIMGKLRKSVKRMIVLNPEAISSWNTGDSIVKYVEKKGIEVYEANTLEKLIDILLTM